MSLPPHIPRVQVQTVGPDPDFTLPKPASLAIVVVNNLLLQLSLFIIVPSSNAYAKHLGGNSTFGGLIIGLPPLVATVALFPLMQYYDGGGYKLPLRLCCIACILGNVLYSLAYATNFLYLILIGRIVSGVGFTMKTYSRKYCSDPRIVGIRRRTTLSSALVMGQGLGTSIGPFFGGLLFKIVSEKNAIFNGFTSPTWIMAIAWLIFWICTEIWYEDIPDDQEYLSTSTASSPLAKSTSKVDVQQQDPLPLSTNTSFFHLSFSQIGVMVCMCWIGFMTFFVLGAWESNIPVFGAANPALRWSPFAAGNFIALGGITTFPFFVGNVFLARRIDDRRILAFGSAMGLSALLVFLALLKTGKINYASIFFCWWAVALGFNIASTLPVSLLSKQLPPSWNTKTSVIIQCSMYIGRAAGAVWGGSGIIVGMTLYTGVEIGLTAVGIVFYAILWRQLKTKRG